MPSRTSQRYLLLRTNKIQPDVTWHISNTTAWVASNILIAPAIISDTTVTRCEVDREELKQYWKSEEKAHLSRWSTSLLPITYSNI